MIRLVGTSHISPQAIKRIEEEIEEGADCVAVELDEGRYRSLVTGEKGGYPSLFFLVASWIQKKLAEKTGVMPGDEMLTAVEKAQEKNIRVYLMDRPIYKTLERFKEISLLNKLKIFLLFFGGLKRYSFSLDEVPSEEIVEEATELLSRRTPELYRVLVDERDEIMARVLQDLSERHEEVIAVVGAGHLPGIKRRLEGAGTEYVDNTFK